MTDSRPERERPSPERFVIDTIAAFYGGADLAEWARNGLFPVTVLMPQLQITIPDAESFVERLELLRGGFGRMGVARVESEVRSVLQPTENDATVGLRNTRIGPDGERLGAHHAVYVLRFAGGRWRFRAISMNDDDANDTEILERLERSLRDATGGEP